MKFDVIQLNVKMNIKNLVFFFVIFVATKAFGVEFQGKFIQGHFIIGKTEPKTKIWIDKQKVRVTDDGYFAFGIGRDRKYDIVISIQKDEKIQRIVKKIKKRKYRIQRIEGLPEKKVTPPKEVYERIKRENKIIAEARAIESDLTFFKKEFIAPLENAIITGVYGSQRILNGKPRRPHYGIDIAAKKGSKVISPTDAIVRLSEKDLYFTGGTIMLDHGHGITSVYSHLSKVLVKKNDKIQKGDVIGLIGSTGRSTGPHLDWRINWFDQRLDPMMFIKNK